MSSLAHLQPCLLVGFIHWSNNNYMYKISVLESLKMKDGFVLICFIVQQTIIIR